MKQSKAYPSLVLGCICLSVALLLSVINMFTAPVITQRENELANAALSEVLPGASNFQNITEEHRANLPESIIEAYSADGGFVFRASGAGRNGPIVIMVGVDADGKITGTKIISESESKGYKETIYSRVEGTNGEYTGQTLETFSPVLQTGSTLSSNGIADAIKAALQAFVIVKGGEVDFRTPEQILQDNCNAALGTTDVAFTRWFATEVIVGVDKVYESTSGYVFLIGKNYVGVNETGVTTAEASDEDKATALAAYEVISNSGEPVEVAVPEGSYNSTRAVIKKAYKTASGNYIFELEAGGYDAVFHYSPGNMSGNPTPISIKLSISVDGKIIDCVTVNHAETQGIGDKCATDEYRESWTGAEAEDVVVSTNTSKPGLGVISGATYTTVGYQSAVKAAFDVFNLLTATEGGNE